MGSNAPAYATAMGPYLPDEQLEPLLERFSYKRYSLRSGTDAAECRQLLRQARRLGYATDVDDRFPGFGSVACPIFNHTGQPTATVGLVGIAAVVERQLKSYLLQLRRASEEISRQLGWQGSENELLLSGDFS